MRSKHKSLMRLTRIYYLQKDFARAAASAETAVKFFQQQWGNPFGEGLFWQALSTFRAGNPARARQIAGTLQDHCSNYPQLDALLKTIGK
ncbi:MAG: hypothetical protein HQK66_08730 [Desulfamplus sp.]|nr:hypothetical protein [Desulfamplus sp.]